MSVRPDSVPEGRTPTRPLRVLYCTRGGFFGALVLRHLRECPEIEICAILRSSLNFKPQFGFLRGALAYIRRSGIAYALYLLVATTLADVLCSLGAIGGVPTRSRAGATVVHTTADINDPVSMQFVRNCGPDLLVSAFFDQRLREEVLAIPALGCVNIHPSLLPFFKGVDPVLQARLHDADLGVTVHYMTPALDAGEILAQRTLAIPDRASVFEATASLFNEGARLLVGQVGRLRRRERGSSQQSQGSYQSWPSRAELRTLRALGYALFRLADLKRMSRRGT